MVTTVREPFCKQKVTLFLGGKLRYCPAYFGSLADFLDFLQRKDHRLLCEHLRRSRFGLSNHNDRREFFAQLRFGQKRLQGGATPETMRAIIRLIQG